MIFLLGGTGYIGRAFQTELLRRNLDYITLPRAAHTSYDKLAGSLDLWQPTFVINAAGYTGKPNVDACEQHKADTMVGSVLLPQIIRDACSSRSVPWGHVSSGCIYNGNNGGQGFSEEDEPNFTFRSPPCSFYSGTKAVAEEALRGADCYLWRLRIPFDDWDDPRNYLTKLMTYERVYDNLNSLSHRGDFVRAALDLWRHRAPFGVYNMTNPGSITTRRVVELIQATIAPTREFTYWANDEEFYKHGAIAPRSNCVLNTGKLQATGITMQPVEHALTGALNAWKAQPAKAA